MGARDMGETTHLLPSPGFFKIKKLKKNKIYKILILI
jgi:hypothetical protein